MSGLQNSNSEAAYFGATKDPWKKKPKPQMKSKWNFSVFKNGVLKPEGLTF